MYNITLIPGDGTGPEISEAAKRVIEATGVPIQWDVQDAGIDVYEKEGTPLPQRVMIQSGGTRSLSKVPLQRLSEQVSEALMLR